MVLGPTLPTRLQASIESRILEAATRFADDTDVGIVLDANRQGAYAAIVFRVEDHLSIIGWLDVDEVKHVNYGVEIKGEWPLKDKK